MLIETNREEKKHVRGRGFSLFKNRKCSNYSSPFQSYRRVKRSDEFIRFLQRMFLTVGVSLTSTYKNRMKIVVSAVIGISMHLFLIYRVLVMMFRIKYAGYTVKLSMFIITREGLVLAVWYSMCAQKKKIMELFKYLLIISQNFPGLKFRKLDRVFYYVSIFVFIFPFIVSVMMVSLLTYPEAEKYQYITTFGVVTKDTSHLFSLLLYCVYNFYLMTLPFMIALMYTYLCINLRKMLQNCCHSLKKCSSFETVDHIFRKSIQLFQVIERIEESLSVCIFFVVSLNLALSFTSFAYVMGYYEMTTSATSGVLAWFFSNQLSFVLIVWTASDVKNEFMRLKRSFQLVLSSFEKNEAFTNLFFQKICIFDSVTLTGWQMFEFNHSLIISASASILTYGLLLLQAEKYISPRSM